MKLVVLSSVLVGFVAAQKAGSGDGPMANGPPGQRSPSGGSGNGPMAGSGMGPMKPTGPPGSNTGRPNTGRPSSGRPTMPNHDGSGDMMDDEDMDDDMDKPFFPVHVKMPKCHGEDVIITESNVRQVCERAYTESDVPMYSPHYPMWLVGHCFSLPARIEMGVAKKNKTLGPDFENFKNEVQESWMNMNETDEINKDDFMNELNQDHEGIKGLTKMCVGACAEAEDMRECVSGCIEKEMGDDMEDEMEMSGSGKGKGKKDMCLSKDSYKFLPEEFRNIAGMTVLRCFHKQLVQDMRRSRVRDTCEWMKNKKNKMDNEHQCENQNGNGKKDDKEFEFNFNFNGMPFEMTAGNSASSGEGQCGRLSDQVGEMQDKMDGMKEMIMGAIGGNCGGDGPNSPSTGRPQSPNGSGTPEKPDTPEKPETPATRPETPIKQATPTKPTKPETPVDFIFDIQEKESVNMVRTDKVFKAQWTKCFKGVKLTEVQNKWKHDIRNVYVEAAKVDFDMKKMSGSDKTVIKKVRDCFKKQKNSKSPAVKAVAVWFNTLKV